MQTNNKCREALLKFCDYANLTLNIGVFRAEHMEKLLKESKAALAEPVRNCEVGTAKEQAHRFHDFCVAHQSQMLGMCSPDCPCIGLADMCHCLTHWAQMPCEKGATDADK